MITLNYTISEQEYKDFYYYIGWQAPDKKQTRIRFHLKNLLIFFGVSIAIFYINKVPVLSPEIILVQILTITLLLFYFAWRIKKYYYGLGKKIFDESDKENSEMIIAESGILGKSKDSEVHYKWSAFTKKYETGSAYYLIMSSNIGLVIPKRVLNSTNQKESFEKMLAQYLPLQAELSAMSN
jgi:hypothetical protein